MFPILRTIITISIRYFSEKSSLPKEIFSVC